MAWVTTIAWSGTPTGTQLTQQLQGNPAFLYSPPSCRAERDTSQSIPNNTGTIINWPVTAWDTDSMRGTSSRIKLTTAGRYQHGTSLELAATAATGGRILTILIVGGADIARDGIPEPSSFLPAALNVHGLRTFSAAQEIESQVVQKSGGALSVLENAAMWAHWLGA